MQISVSMHPRAVRLYTQLYAARFGLVIHPQPLGAFNPRLCRMMRFTEVRAAIRLLRIGMPTAAATIIPCLPLTLNFGESQVSRGGEIHLLKNRSALIFFPLYQSCNHADLWLIVKLWICGKGLYKK